MTTLNRTLAEAIDVRKDELAQLIVDEQWTRNPDFSARYGDSGRAKCRQDVRYTLAYLSQAIASDSPPLFAAYMDWVKLLFDGLKIPTWELAESLGITGQLLRRRFPEEAAMVGYFITLGLEHLASPPIAPPSFINDSQPLSGLAHHYLDNLRNGERSAASHLILDAVDQGTRIRDLYLQIFQPCQYEIGRLWQMNQMSVAQEHYCTAAT